MKKSNTQEFIEKARAVHGNLYRYHEVNYVGSKQRVTIVCREHGRFTQRPNDHLTGSGCSACGLLKLKPVFELDNDYFISKARLKHGDRYDYSKLMYYRGKKAKVEIICRHHGSFFQIATDHLRGNGCRFCSMSMIRKSRRKKYLLGVKEVVVQGYEPQALDYITSKIGVDPTHILTGKRVPRIRYRHQNREHLHFPDIFIPKLNRLVEVKSPYTLITTLSVLKRKRRAAIEKGYNYSVFVMEADGTRIRLPKCWHLLSTESLKKKLEV